jgi:DNA-directed RNA polymerase specialized sigma24 family protein
MASQDEEFTSIFKEVYANLYRFLECLLGERSAAQDMAQESFLRLHRFGLYRLPPNEARFWLFRVARNLVLNEMQKNQTRMRLSAKAAGVFRGRAPDPEAEDWPQRHRDTEEIMKISAISQFFYLFFASLCLCVSVAIPPCPSGGVSFREEK